MKPLHNTAHTQTCKEQESLYLSESYKSFGKVFPSISPALCSPSAVSAGSVAALRQSAQQELFQQALSSEVQGNPQQARYFFDALLGNRTEADAAVPSAADSVSLGAYPCKRQAQAIRAVARRASTVAEQPSALVRFLAQSPFRAAPSSPALFLSAASVRRPGPGFGIASLRP